MGLVLAMKSTKKRNVTSPVAPGTNVNGTCNLVSTVVVLMPTAPSSVLSEQSLRGPFEDVKLRASQMTFAMQWTFHLN